MFGEHHPLTPKAGPAKVAWGLSLTHLLVLGIGAGLSYRLARIVPPLPFKNFVLAHVHHFVPLGAAALLLFAREGKTGLNLAVYLAYLVAYKVRRKVYIWRR